MHTAPTLEQPMARYALVWLAAALLIMFFGRGLIDPDEGRYAEIPREMTATGNWLEMRMLDYRYYEKPPLAYWLTAPAIALCGARDWAVRLPLFFNMGLIVLLFYRLMRRHWPAGIARQTMLVSTASVGFTAGLSLLMTDPFLTLFFGLTCYWAYRWFLVPAAETARRARLAAAAGAAAALGFLTKGAVAVVLPGAIILLWMAWEKRWRTLRGSLMGWAGVVFLLIAGGALLLIESHNPGFSRHFVWQEHIARFIGTRELQGHPEPVWFFAIIIPLLLAPWTFFVPRAVRMMIIRRALQTDQLTRLLLVWAVVVVAFFSASTGKLMSYILPALLPMLLLLGRWGLAEPADGTRADRRLIRVGMAGPLIVAASLYLGWLVSYGQILPDDVQPVRGISILAFVPLALAWPALRRLRDPHDFFPPLALLNAGILLTTALMLSPLAGRNFNVTAHNNSSVVYQALAERLEPADRIISLWSYRPSLPFYTQRIYRPFQSQNELLFGMRMEPGRPGDMQDADEIRAMAAAAPGRLYALIEPDDYLKRFPDLRLKHRETDLPRDPQTIVLEILP